MKRLYLFCLLVFLAFSASAFAQDGKLSKTLQKECKNQIKQLKKEGWTVCGQIQTIESALEGHFLKMQRTGGFRVEGRAKAKDINNAKNIATAKAQAEYSKTKGTKQEGENIIKISNIDGEDIISDQTIDINIHSKTASQIINFDPTVILCRETEDGMIEVLEFFVVNFE